jgi:FtsZ-interacting cell division protein ZipA
MEINNTTIIAIVIVILLIFAYIYFRKNKESIRGDGKKTKSRGKKKRQDDESLYKLIHDDMVNNMSLEDFKEKVGNDYDDSIYIEIKQLYNTTNPEKIKESDYDKILNKE